MELNRTSAVAIAQRCTCASPYRRSAIRRFTMILFSSEVTREDPPQPTQPHPPGWPIKTYSLIARDNLTEILLGKKVRDGLIRTTIIIPTEWRRSIVFFIPFSFSAIDFDSHMNDAIDLAIWRRDVSRCNACGGLKHFVSCKGKCWAKLYTKTSNRRQESTPEEKKKTKETLYYIYRMTDHQRAYETYICTHIRLLLPIHTFRSWLDTTFKPEQYYMCIRHVFISIDNIGWAFDRGQLWQRPSHLTASSYIPPDL